MNIMRKNSLSIKKTVMNSYKMNIVLTLIMIFMVSSIKAQDYTNYYNLTNQAMTSMVEKDYEKAIDLYNEAFKLEFPFPDDVSFLKDCYLAIDDKEGAYVAMRLMVKSGYKLPLIVENGEQFVYRRTYLTPSVVDTVFESKLLKEYNVLRENFVKHVDTESDKYLFALVQMEMFVRNLRAVNSKTKYGEILTSLTKMSQQQN